MTRYYLLLLSIFSLLFAGCGDTTEGKSISSPTEADEIRPREGIIPMVRLLVTPEKYDGKKVMVFVVVQAGFEIQGAFESRGAAIHPSNGIWIDGDLSKYYTDDVRWYGGYVAGTFHAGKRGHMGMWSGSIGELDRLDLWPLPDSKEPNQPPETTPASAPR